MSSRNDVGRLTALTLLLLIGACSGRTPSTPASNVAPAAQASTRQASAAPEPNPASASDTAAASESEWLERRAHLEPEDRELRRRLAEAYLSEGRFDRAIETARQLLADSHPPAGTRLLLARALYGAAILQPDTAGFLHDIAEADSLVPRSGELDTVRVVTAERRADAVKAQSLDAALRFYDRAGSPSARTKAIRMLVEARRFTEARGRIAALMSGSFDDAERAEAIGLILPLDPHQAGFWAARDHRAVPDGTARLPESALLAFRRGAAAADSAQLPALVDALLAAGRKAEALAILDRAPLDLAAAHAELLVNAALASGRKEKAVSILLALDENRRAALGPRADAAAGMLLDAGNADGAMMLAERFPLSRSTRARIAQRLGELGRFEEAVRFDDGRGDLRAMAALRKGDTEGALADLRRLRGEGLLDAAMLEILDRFSNDAAERRLVELERALRGRAPWGERAARAMASPQSRAFLTERRDLRARDYLECGVPARAERLLLAQVKSDPALLPLLVHAARLAGDTAAEFAFVAPALAANESAAELHVVAFEKEKRAGNRTAMIAHLERAMSLAGNEDEIRGIAAEELPKVYVAEAAARFSDRAYALALLEKARELRENDPVILYNIAMIRSLAGDVDSALADLQECFRAGEGDVDALILAAGLYKTKGRNADAAEAYKKAIALGAPVRVRHDLALLLARLGDTAGAFVAAAEARRLAPSDARIARTYGVLAARSEKWAEAAAALEESVKTYPHDAEAMMLLARACVETGRARDALRLAAALADPLDRTEIMARAEMNDGRAVDAVGTLRPFASRPRFRPLYAHALSMAADALLAKGRLSEARVLWRAWLLFDSSAAMPRTLLAAAAPEPSPPPAAPTRPAVRADTRLAPQPESAPRVPLPPRSGDTLPSLKDAALALKSGRFSTAEKFARRLVEADRANTTAWNILGLALSREERRSEAAAAFRASLAARPEQPEVRAAIDELEREAR